MQPYAAAATYRIHRYPTECIESWSLDNGERATLRPVLPQDDASEQDFVARLSPESRRNRFHGAVNGLSAARAAEMTNIDYRQHMGFVVTAMDGDAEIVIADAHCVLADDGESAEFALVVADAWRGLGLGKRLVRALCHSARCAGARWLCGQVLAGNRDMLALMERCGFSRRETSLDDAFVQVERSVALDLPCAAHAPANDSLFGGLGQSLARSLADSVAHWIAPRHENAARR